MHTVPGSAAGCPRKQSGKRLRADRMGAFTRGGLPLMEPLLIIAISTAKPPGKMTVLMMAMVIRPRWERIQTEPACMAYGIWLAMSMSGWLIGLDPMAQAVRLTQRALTPGWKELPGGAPGVMILPTFARLSAHE